MTAQLVSADKRDAFAKRLDALAEHMLRSRDQGHDGRIMTTMEMIEDIRCAAVIVRMSDIAENK